jgi:hypothetical protein
MSYVIKDLLAVRTTWWIAHDGCDIVHWGVVGAGQHVTTGQPDLESFATELAWLTRLVELQVDTADAGFIAAAELALAEADRITELVGTATPTPSPED